MSFIGAEVISFYRILYSSFFTILLSEVFTSLVKATKLSFVFFTVDVTSTSLEMFPSFFGNFSRETYADHQEFPPGFNLSKNITGNRTIRTAVKHSRVSVNVVSHWIDDVDLRLGASLKEMRTFVQCAKIWEKSLRALRREIHSNHIGVKMLSEYT